MKKLRFLLLLLSPLFLAFTCDDDPSDDTPSGTWSLTKVTGGIAGVSHDFEIGTITWKFSLTGQGRTLTVENNNTDTNVEDFFDTGVYNYQYVDNSIPNACEHVTVVEETDLGCQSQSHGVLTFTQLVDDGYVLTLHKN